ncbi:MAG: hypothetical protein OEL83_19405 [Desulforhopalus sp.]|nr:hypothetical protein [Desulforhopalus sp.]
MAIPQQIEKLIEEIRLYIRYAVPEQAVEEANALVERYRRQPRILRLLREHYVALPDALEEPVIRVSKIVQRQGVYLFVLTSASAAHLYAVSHDEVVWLGEYPVELDQEVLDLWGLANQEEFLKICPPVKELEDYIVDGDYGNRGECPACGVEEGEYHLLGCSVEICPWCEGQLSKCNCRFEQLEAEAVHDEEQLERFLDLLTAKGRIPFMVNQAPYYPGTSDGLDRDEKES